MAYADAEYYKEQYLLGRAAAIPAAEFPFWEKKAETYIDTQSMGRITPDNAPDAVRQCACALAEHFFSVQGTEFKTGESVSGFGPVTYRQGVEAEIITMHLSGTGLLYRGLR